MDFWSGDQYDAEVQRLYEDGDYDAALGLLNQAIEKYPDSPALYVSLGYTRLAREEYPLARQAFETALLLDPDDEEAMTGFGECCLKLGERSRAFHAFEQVLEMGFSNDLELLLSIGRALVREDLLERAERFVRLAVEAEPENADACLDLGYLMYRKGDGSQALRWSRRAVRLDPGYDDARALYGNLLYDKGEFRAALDQLGRLRPGRVLDPLVAWRIVELLGRIENAGGDDPRVIAYMAVLDELSVDPSAEDVLLAELEAAAAGDVSRLESRSQLDLFGRPPIPPQTDHRVRAPDGWVYEGDWEGIVRAMRDRSNPSVTVAEFMEYEAKRLRIITGSDVATDDPRRFIEDSARLGALEIEH